MRDSKPAGHQDNTDSLREDNLQLPATLDEQSIASHLKMISRTHPQQLPRTAQAIRAIWAYRVGGWAEQSRLEYLDTVLLQLKTSHEILSQSLAMDDEWQSHLQEKAGRRAEAVVGIPDLEAEAKAEELRARIARARTEQADAKKKREDIERPSKPTREPSGEERRKQKLKVAENDLNRLIARRDKCLSEYLKGRPFDAMSPQEQEEYRLDENRYNDRIRQAKEKKMQFE